MNTIILLNEWTKIEVKESKEEIKILIAEKVWIEKQPYCWKDFHFIELTRMIIERDFHNSTQYKYNEEKIDLYYKRILFIN